jgi:hypothetical protein
MKQHVKRIFRALWRLAQPVRHPLTQRLTRFFDERFSSQLGPRFAHIDVIQRGHGDLVRDVELLSESMVRELVRLQTQVETIEQLLQSLLADAVSEGDAHPPLAAGLRDRAA